MSTDKVEEMCAAISKKLALRQVDEQLSLCPANEKLKDVLLAERRRLLVETRNSPPPRTQTGAMELLTDSFPGRECGLRKQCPRCLRGGWVFVSTENPRHAAIVWDGRPRSGFVSGVDVDLCDVSELFRSNFGCGYDDPKEFKVTIPKEEAP